MPPIRAREQFKTNGRSRARTGRMEFERSGAWRSALRPPAHFAASVCERQRTVDQCVIRARNLRNKFAHEPSRVADVGT
jgi:hypothetical protein